MLKAFTFLGTGNYQETTYSKHDDESKKYKTIPSPIYEELSCCGI